MQTENLKKLTINKLNEYPEISLQEQMELKGGGSWTKIVDWILRGLGGASDLRTLWDAWKNDKNYGEYATGSQTELEHAIRALSPNDSTFITVDSITPNGTYGLQIRIYGYGQ